MGFGKKCKTFRNSLCGMNVGLVYVLKIILRDCLSIANGLEDRSKIGDWDWIG